MVGHNGTQLGVWPVPPHATQRPSSPPTRSSRWICRTATPVGRTTSSRSSSSRAAVGRNDVLERRGRGRLEHLAARDREGGVTSRLRREGRGQRRACPRGRGRAPPCKVLDDERGDHLERSRPALCGRPLQFGRDGHPRGILRRTRRARVAWARSRAIGPDFQWGHASRSREATWALREGRAEVHQPGVGRCRFVDDGVAQRPRWKDRRRDRCRQLDSQLAEG